MAPVHVVVRQADVKRPLGPSPGCCGQRSELLNNKPGRFTREHVTSKSGISSLQRRPRQIERYVDNQIFLSPDHSPAAKFD